MTGRCTGTCSSYQRGCRCEDCRRSSTEAKRRVRAKQRGGAPKRDLAWRERAACKGKLTDWWFALPSNPQLQVAQAICMSCPVRAECTAEAKAEGEVGLWGNAWRAPWLSGSYRAGWKKRASQGYPTIDVQGSSETISA